MQGCDSSMNILQYPRFCKTLLKLAVAWVAASMLYYGIILGTLPGGLLMNNFYMGMLSVLAGPCMICFLKLRVSHRLSLCFLYLMSALCVLSMAFFIKNESTTTGYDRNRLR